MKISIKSTNIDLTPSLNTFISTKLDSLSKLVKKFDSEGLVTLNLEVARTTRHHHKGDVFMAEANLKLPGKTLRAVDKNEDIRTAIDNMRQVLGREIEKYKTQNSPGRSRKDK